MTRANAFRFISALSCLIGSVALSQQIGIHKIVIDGTTPYSATSIQQAALLHEEEAVTAADIQEAADRLRKTGAFSSVKVAIEGTPAESTIVFTLAMIPSSHLLTVGFEDFVWFTPQQLNEQVAKLVPLFNGTIPDSPGQLNDVALALEHILSQQGITASVSQVPVQTPSGPAEGLAEYRANSPNVVVHSITLQGVSTQLTSAALANVESLIGTPYNEGRSPLSLTTTLLAPFQDAGYPNSSVELVSREVVSKSTASPVQVDVVALVHEGLPYHVTSINWPGSSQLTKAQFAAITALHPGDLAKRQGILQTTQNVAAAYRSQGFLEVTVNYLQYLNVNTNEAVINVSAIPGPRFKLRSINPVNLTAAQKTAFISSWQLSPGSFYNQGYVDKYVGVHTNIQNYNTSFETTASPEEYLVDLTITFAKGSS